MKITSSEFSHGEYIPKKYTCNGDNINPTLIFENVPSNAKSLVLIVDDPDVPVVLREDRMYDHWVLYNINPKTTEILENNVSKAVVGVNTNNEPKYQGPCPPDTIHRYFFKLYALDMLLDLEEGATKKEVELAMEGHVIEEAKLIGLYEQPDEFKTIK